MSSYATPGFSWALPEEKKELSPVTRKPLRNPLLSRKSPTPSGSDAPDFRSPFTPMANGGSIRQRRKPATPLTGSARKLVPPPKRSLLMGDAGIGPQDADVRPQPRTIAHTLPVAEASPLPKLTTGDALERWVLVYGFGTEAEFQLVVRRFKNFGKIEEQRASSNWVAFQYESLMHTEQALCQPCFLLMDGLLIGTTRLTASLQGSLDWNSAASSLVLAPVRSTVSRVVYKAPDEEVLLLGDGSEEKMVAGKRNVCEMILRWVFGW